MSKDTLVAICFVVIFAVVLWRLYRWRAARLTEPLAEGGRVLWIALAFVVGAPLLVVWWTPSGGRVLDRCIDDQHAAESLATLSREGPWQHPRLGRLEVIAEPLSVKFANYQRAARLFLPAGEGVLALRWQAPDLPLVGVQVEDGEVELVVECRPVQGYQVGPGAASLSFDLGKSFSWWSTADAMGVTQKIR